MDLWIPYALCYFLPGLLFVVIILLDKVAIAIRLLSKVNRNIALPSKTAIIIQSLTNFSVSSRQGIKL